MRLGTPHLHLRDTSSTNDRARELATAGAPHGTLVTADSQSAGRGRQGRRWSTSPGSALLMSVVLREPHALLPLAAAVAVAQACGPAARVKWPNDVQLAGRKVAGILAEGRPQEGWAVLGIGVNVAVGADDLPGKLRERATGLGLTPADVPEMLARVLAELDVALALRPAALLDAWRARDALLGQPVAWGLGAGTAAGIDDAGRLLVARSDGSVAALDAGEVHLTRAFRKDASVEPMNFKKLTDQAKAAIDKRGGTESLKGDLAELKGVARGKGTLKEKAKAAADKLKEPRPTPGAGAPGTGPGAGASGTTPAPGGPGTVGGTPPTAQDLPPRS